MEIVLEMRTEVVPVVEVMLGKPEMLILVEVILGKPEVVPVVEVVPVMEVVLGTYTHHQK